MKKLIRKLLIGIITLGIISIVLSIALLLSIYFRDVDNDLYPGTTISNIYWPEIGWAKDQYTTYGDLNCVYIILSWDSQISPKTNPSEIVNYYSDKWKSYPWPMKSPGNLVYYKYIGSFFIHIYKGNGANMYKYGVHTIIFICQKK